MRMKEERRSLEGDGAVVGDVSGDDASGLGHLVTGHVQLAHLSQAARQKRERTG